MSGMASNLCPFWAILNYVNIIVEEDEMGGSCSTYGEEEELV
jgi:hypothetical protein